MSQRPCLARLSRLRLRDRKRPTSHMYNMDRDVWGINHQWARFLFSELIRNGMRTFLVSTGGRSTALAVALADIDGVDVTVHPDERGAAYFAVGYGRATGTPAVLLCTSGTAAANYYPAVIEASMACVPLIVVTADRPAEVRDTRDDQVIDQTALYSTFVRWRFDFPAPAQGFDPQAVLTTVDYAVSQATGHPPGPVHLNCCLPRPYVSDPEDRQWYQPSGLQQAWRGHHRPFTTYHPAMPAVAEHSVHELATQLARAKKGLIACGPMPPFVDGAAIRRLAQHLRWPLLADVTSNVRFAMTAPERDVVQAPFDLYVRDEQWARWYDPDLILHFGSELVNEAIQAYLRDTAAAYILVNHHPFRQDPGRVVSQRVVSDPSVLASWLLEVTPPAPSGLHRAFRRADAISERLLHELLQQDVTGSEWQIVPHLLHVIAPQSGLFLGNSLPVREFDRFATPQEKALWVTSNRGVSGIDGNLACGAGFALGLQRPTTIFTGDVAFLYDLNSLLFLSRLEVPVTVVIPNNDGGGIFPFMSQVARTKRFEELFVASHGLVFESAAQQFGVSYCRVEGPSSFAAAYRTALESRQPAIVEVHTDRDQNVVEQHEIQARIRHALREEGMLSS